MVNPFPIPEGWPRAFGMPVTRTAVAALWGARNDNGTIFLYAEHLSALAEPSQNVRAIRKLGDWIPGVINLSCIKGSQTDRDTVLKIYRELHLDLEESMAGEDASVYRLWQLLASDGRKVFASQSEFLNEYRIGDEQSPLLLCSHALVVSGLEKMRTKPAPKLGSGFYLSFSSGPQGWMGA